MRKLRVFVGCPNDLTHDRDALRDVIDELNRGVANERRIVLEFLTWEHVPPDMGRPEQIILDQIGQSDIFIGLMGRRFGTSTGRYDGGTEEEFYTAYNQYMSAGKPRIMFYFNQESAPPPRTEGELEQISRVLRFRGAIGDKGLYREYHHHDGFVASIRQHLTSVVLNWGGAPGPKNITEPTPVGARYWPVWRDARVEDRGADESLEGAVYRNAKASVKFLTISGRSIYTNQIETCLKGKPRGFAMKLLLFDWRSPHFAAKMRHERRETETEIDMARRKAQDVAEQFLCLAQGFQLDLQVKLYSEYPVWRLLIADEDRAYTGYYLPNKRGYEGPLLLFESSDASGLFYPVKQYFDILWDASYGPVRLGDPCFSI